MSNGITNIFLSMDVQFGEGCISNLGKKAKSLGMKKILIVCDQTMTKLGLAKRVGDLLGEADIGSAVFDQCVENPTVENADAGAILFKKETCDGLIGLGGGSSMDAAKAIRVVANYGGSAADYDVKKGGVGKIGKDLVPMVAIPTTSGTGSEATNGGVITDKSRNVKFIVASPHLNVSAAILDPALTLTVPPLVTAATGFDALVHAMEAYVAKGYNPVADGVCEKACFLVGKSLRKAVRDGNDIDARADMMMAALLGGMAITLKGLGAVHALAHPLGGTFGIAHGVANALMLPYVMKHNASVGESRYIEAVKLMGFKATSTEDAAQVLIGLAQELGLPTKLSKLGVKEEKLSQLAKDAANDLSLPRNPVKCDEESLLNMYLKAM